MGILIIADDLTGANDTGVKIFKHNVPTCVHLDGLPMDGPIEDCIVINTETRALTSKTAASKIRDLFKNFDWPCADIVYKKIDSTMRGNIGSEIDAILSLAPLEGAIIAPAYPENGRIVVGGYQLVNNKLLEDTEFARDYKNPIEDSFLPDILANQSKSKVYQVSIKQVRSGELDNLLTKKLMEGYKYFILDSVETEDLDKIAESMGPSISKFLWVGSAGLANSLVRHRPIPNKTDKPRVKLKQEVECLPILVLAGSMKSTTRRQIQYLRENGYSILEIDPLLLLELRNREEELLQLIHEAEKELISKKCIVLTIKQSEQVSINIQAYKDLYQLTNHDIGNNIASQFGRIGATLTQKIRLAGLVLTGGDIAFQTCYQLNIKKVDMIGEVEEGIPLVVYKNKQNHALKLVTKAGGFGREDTLSNAICKIKLSEGR
ncbi:four-carbon acid sugar kinase family protein [Mesobacillus maritimus]|uniref:Four-carbon acid sugar kinase family protein n=1 Tax=Mesobacillus maritimus TaxID=1643336 RepID=A0ABS7JZC7_9BACI|nr:four-carbon acid sugar kinase family protein [Mesobacillus maritimus]MBY0095352.1 four-carbon acid sugar kinase family protein [Mesobacillus maritimus]